MTITERIFLAIGVAASLFLVSLSAIADHAQWIHEKHAICCIPHEDCHPFKGKVSYDKGFFSFTWKDNLVRWPEGTTRLSEDQDYWVCEDQYLGGVRCFFRPRMGS